MPMRHIPHLLLLLLCILALSSLMVPAAQARITVESGFEPQTLQVGRTGQFKITIQGSQEQARGSLPTVDGLSIISSGSQRNFSVIQNRMIAQTTHLFQVKAEEPGTYTLPAFTIYIGQDSFEIPEHTLTVVPRSEEDQQRLFLELKLPRKTLYAGETIPAEVMLYAADSVTGEILQHAPIQVGESFSVSRFPTPPNQTTTDRNGIPYTKLTWPTTLTPLRSGELDLTFEISLAVDTDQQASRMPRQRHFRSFFDDFFRERERIDLSTPQQPIIVLPLPEENKPENFTGAIGLFSITEPSPMQSLARVGEPLTLKVEISGQGNFSRITPPPLETGPAWRSYSPQMEFTGQDPLQYQGTQTIEYIVIPRESGTLLLPTVQFSYFNPETREYIELAPRTGRTIEVMPSPYTPQPEEPTPRLADTVDESTDKLLPIRKAPGRWLAHQPPLIHQGWFWSVQALPALALVLLISLRHQRWKMENDPAYARRRRAKHTLQSTNNQLATAVSQNNPSLFMATLPMALRWWIILHVDLSASEAMTAQEIMTLLEKKQASDDCRERIARLLKVEEAWRYAGNKAIVADLNRLMDDFRQLKYEAK